MTAIKAERFESNYFVKVPVYTIKSVVNIVWRLLKSYNNL
jgi:hypothetical protein